MVFVEYIFVNIFVITKSVIFFSIKASSLKIPCDWINYPRASLIALIHIIVESIADLNFFFFNPFSLHAHLGGRYYLGDIPSAESAQRSLDEVEVRQFYII